MSYLQYVTILNEDRDVLLGDLERLINQNNMIDVDKKLYSYLIGLLVYGEGVIRSDKIVKAIATSINQTTILSALINLSRLISIPLYTIENDGVFEIVKYVNGIPIRTKLTSELLDGAITNILKVVNLLEVKDE